MFDKFLGPMSQRTRDNQAPVMYRSLCQSSEWGMRALQGIFTRLKSLLTSKNLKRKYTIGIILLLHNFRTQLIT